MTRREFDDHEHFVRHCSHQQLSTDEHGNVLGVTFAAFQLRQTIGETYLSGALLESVRGGMMIQLAAIRTALSQTRQVKPRHAFAVCSAASIRAAGEVRTRKLRVQFEPKSSNATYSALRGLPQDNSDIDLLEALAANTVVNLVASKDVP